MTSAKMFSSLRKMMELYSSVFENKGYDPLPCYEENPETTVSAPQLVLEVQYQCDHDP
jgi:hypothetical protein